MFGSKLTIPHVISQGTKEIPYCSFQIIPGVGVYAKTDRDEVMIPFSNVICIQYKPESKGGLTPVA